MRGVRRNNAVIPLLGGLLGAVLRHKRTYRISESGKVGGQAKERRGNADKKALALHCCTSFAIGEKRTLGKQRKRALEHAGDSHKNRPFRRKA